jgi:hypothetical protein
VRISGKFSQANDQSLWRRRDLSRRRILRRKRNHTIHTIPPSPCTIDHLLRDTERPIRVIEHLADDELALTEIVSHARLGSAVGGIIAAVVPAVAAVTVDGSFGSSPARVIARSRLFRLSPEVSCTCCCIAGADVLVVGGGRGRGGTSYPILTQQMQAPHRHPQAQQVTPHTPMRSYTSS